MRMRLLTGITLVLALAAGGRQARAAEADDMARDQAPAWGFESGWAVLPGVASAGEGLAVNVIRHDHGPALADGAEPTVTANASGGYDLVYEGPGYRLTDRYEPWPELGDGAWKRRVHYTNTGEETVDLDHTMLRVRAASVAETWEPSTFRMARLDDGRIQCVSFWSEGDDYGYGMTDGVITVRVNAAWRLAPGQEAAVGRMGIWTGDGAGPDPFRAEARRWYRAQGFAGPLEYPDWFREGVLYEASAAGHIDSRFSDVGGFDAFARQLPYLADLGVSAMWLNAVQRHKSPPNPTEGGWNHYDPLDLMEVDPVLGGDDGLRRLATAMEENGIAFISEIVPHGGHSVQASAMEAWWTRDREGNPERPWGGYGMDNASPEWQGAVRDSMAMLAEKFSIRGARIDVIDGQGLNWGSPLTNHASQSVVGGGVGIIGAVRDGILAGPEPRPVILPESIKNRPEYYAVEDAAVAGYGFDLERLLLHGLEFDVADAARLRETLGDFFERERGALPEGALVLRTLNNHDTVCEGGRAQLRFGAGLARALYGVCLSVPGVPMMYQEEEVGSFDALRRLNWTRRGLAPLIHGDERYDVAFAPEVFTVLRSWEGRHVLALSNLSGKRIDGEAVLPEDTGLPSDAAVTDAVSGATGSIRDGRLTWSLPPYATAFLCLGFEPDIALPPPRFGGEVPSRPMPAATGLRLRPHADGVALQVGDLVAEFVVERADWESVPLPDGGYRLVSPGGTLSATPAGNGAVDIVCRIDAGPLTPVLRVFNADAWQVSGRTAVLHDQFIRRHYPFPEDSGYAWNRTHFWGGYPAHRLYNAVSPSGRLWQSVIEPLHPEDPGLAFSDDDGAALVIRDFETDAGNTVLTNCADEADPEPLRLETRFYADDPDLHPLVRRYGVDAPWKIEGAAPDAAPRGVSVAFRVTVGEDSGAAFDAERLPFAGHGGVVRVEGGPSSQIGPFLLLPEPARVVWHDLPGVPGTWRIGMMLRHSESGPDDTSMTGQYVVMVNGEEQAIEWTELDVHRHGNAYLGMAWTPPVDLGGGPCTVSVTSDAQWGGVGRELRLRPAP